MAYRTGFTYAVWLSVLGSCPLHPQGVDGRNSFEVASVKPAGLHSSDRPSIVGGPGSPLPGEFVAKNISLRDLLLATFDIMPYQLSGPAWLASEHYEIFAKLPPGTTKEAFRAMQQGLLVERFELKFHHAEREMRGYGLVVDKGGLKIKETPIGDFDSVVSGEVERYPRVGKDGLLLVPPGATKLLSFKGGAQEAIVGANVSMEMLAGALSHSLKSDVVDQTGLLGRYTFRVDFLKVGWVPREPRPGGGDTDVRPENIWSEVFTALRQQLGLRLDPLHTRVDTIIVDSANRLPLEN